MQQLHINFTQISSEMIQGNGVGEEDSCEVSISFQILSCCFNVTAIANRKKRMVQSTRDYLGLDRRDEAKAILSDRNYSLARSCSFLSMASLTTRR